MVVESLLKIENAAEQDELRALEGAEIVELIRRRAESPPVLSDDRVWLKPTPDFSPTQGPL